MKSVFSSTDSRRIEPNGWILLETIVALAVLSIGMIGLNRALEEALVTRALARDYTQARFLLEEVVSEVELQPVLVDGASKSGAFGEDYPGYNYSWKVSRYNLPKPSVPPAILQRVGGEIDWPVDHIGQLEATVTWTRRGRTYSVSAQTRFSPSRLYVQEEHDQLHPQPIQ